MILNASCLPPSVGVSLLPFTVRNRPLFTSHKRRLRVMLRLAPPGAPSLIDSNVPLFPIALDDPLGICLRPERSRKWRTRCLCYSLGYYEIDSNFSTFSPFSFKPLLFFSSAHVEGTSFLFPSFISITAMSRGQHAWPAFLAAQTSPGIR